MGDCRTGCFDEAPAAVADQMFMFRVAEGVFEMGMYVRVADFTDQSGFHHQVERPVDGAAADMVFRAGQFACQIVGAEVVVPAEHVQENRPARPGDPVAAFFQKLFELRPCFRSSCFHVLRLILFFAHFWFHFKRASFIEGPFFD